jgi:hypothetical protein
MHIQPDAANPQGKIEGEQFISAEEVAKEAALQLVCQDTTRVEGWLQANYWSLRWREGDGLYQSPPSIQLWEGTTVPRSNVNRFVVAETVNSIHPQIMNGLFYETPAFILRPRPNQSENATRAITELLAIELQMMNVRQEIDWGIFSALLFGTGIWKWGFKTETKNQTKYVPVGNPVKVPSPLPGQPDTEIETADSMAYKKIVEPKEIHIPTFEYKDIRYILVDPGSRVPDIRKSKFVIDRMYMTYYDLIKLADEEYVDTDANGKQSLKKMYDLPSEDTIREWFMPPVEQTPMPGSTEAIVTQGTTYIHHAKTPYLESTEDPLMKPMEVLERWDNGKVITVLNRKKVIRNQPNEFGVIPFLSVNWWNIPDAFWGLGLGRVIGVEQRVQAGLINACLDLAALIVNPMFVRARSANIQEQQIRQRIGGILTVDGPVKEAFTMLEQPTIPNEVIQQIGLSQSRVEMTSGASAGVTMGANTGKQGMARSGTGASALIQATMTRIGGFTEMFVKQVYEPLLYQIHELNKDKMPIGYIREVLGDKIGPEFKFDAGDFLNAPAEFEVLAGSHLAAKAQMAQSLFMMIQLFESAPLMDQLAKVANKKIDVSELFRMVCDVSGWKNTYDIIKDMSPEEVQRQQMQNPAMAKVQGQMTVNNQKFGQQQQLIDQENEARVVRDILRHIAEKSAEPEALLGAPPTEGMGSNETA